MIKTRGHRALPAAHRPWLRSPVEEPKGKVWRKEDPREEVDICLNCTRARCVNCLGSDTYKKRRERAAAREAEQAAAAKAARAVSTGSPCERCPRRAACEKADGVCRAWMKWVGKRCAALHAAGGGTAACT